MIHRRAIVGIVVAASVSLLAGCGFQAPAVEDTEQASVQATDFHVGLVQVANTNITEVTTDSGIPRFFLVATFVNDGTQADTLTSVTSTQGSVTVVGPGTTDGQITLPPGVPVLVNVPSPTSFGPTMAVSASPTPQVGGYVPITFNFATSGGSGVVQVPVLPAGETTAPTQPVPAGQATAPAQVGETASD